MARESGIPCTLWKATLALVGVALLGSAWAAFFAQGCGSCGGAAGSISGGALARAGVVYYTLLLGAGFCFGRSRLFWCGLLLAASLHAALLIILLTRREFCPPCLVTGTAAIAAAVLSCLVEPFNLARASVILPGVALATQLGIFSLGLFSGSDALEVKASPVAPADFSPGRVRMVIYERGDCVFCQRLRAEVLPEILAEFGRTLEVEYRSAEELPGLPTPTIILTGAGGRRSFPGLPSGQVLRGAILETQGGGHDRQAMLPASR